ncbi:hypothetical protein OSTOST_12806, partial [Ostertagia ostertagi]
IGFRRKCSFFARLGVLFRLQIADGEHRTPQDYRAVYPILYRTLPGYGIKENVREVAQDGVLKGPIQLQIKALHEVYTAASRAELTDAAIRHLCHLIQVYYDDMEPTLANRLFDDLQNLVRIKKSPPQLNQRISVPVGNIILPSIQLTRFPMVNDPILCPLPPHLAPTVIPAKAGQPQLFIYSPFQQKKASNAVLQLESSLPRAPIEEDLNDRSTEITVYSGQLFEHSLTVRNTSATIAIRKVLLQVWQPKVSGGPSMIELSSQTDDESFSLAPLEEKEIKFRIFGIDPTATADDEGSEERIVETVLPLASTMVELPPDSEAHDLIPYTGRLLTCQFLFQYIADVVGPNEE